MANSNTRLNLLAGGFVGDIRTPAEREHARRGESVLLARLVGMPG